MKTARDRAVDRIMYLLLMFESIENNTEDFYDLATPDSELEADDAFIAPFQTSHLVGHCLAVSLDAIRTARLVLQKPGGGLRVPMIGVYPLLRTVIEASSLAVWLLMPDARSERLTRSLRARMDDVMHDDRLVIVMTDPAEGESRESVSTKQKTRRANSVDVRMKKRRLRELAAAIGASVEDINKGLPGFGPIIEQAAPALGLDPNMTRGTWSFVSGLTHPSVSRSIMGSNIEWVDEESRALLTADFGKVGWAMDAAINAHLTALKLTTKRGGRADVEWHPGADFPAPPGYVRLRYASAADA